MSAGNRHDAKVNEALESLCRIYWPAVHSYIRRWGHDPETARDLTQEFFARLLEKDWLSTVDPGRGRFRAFLKTVVQRFLIDEQKASQRLKRGGGAALISLEELMAEETRPAVLGEDWTADQEFDRRWAMAVVERTFLRLRREAETAGQASLFKAVQGLLTDGAAAAPLAEIGAAYGLGVSAVKMRLHRWRARYRELLLEEVANTVPSLADLHEEVRHLMQALSGR